MSDESWQWNERYERNEAPWDSGRPSTELIRVLDEDRITPARTLEIGCGTGTNSVYLAQNGFEVTGMDLAPRAIQQAEMRAREAKVNVRFVTGDILSPPDLGGRFQFFFDRGCYHAVRRIDAAGYVAGVKKMLAPGAMGLILTGNANEPHEKGPPVVTEEEIRRELGSVFEIVRLREFRFDTPASENFLAWSCLLRFQ